MGKYESEASILAGDAFVFRSANGVERVAEMLDDVEPVEQDRGLRHVTLRRFAKRLPHVHRRKLDFPAGFLAQERIEQIHVGFRAPFAAEPNGAACNEIADNDAIGMPLLDRDLVNADDARLWMTGHQLLAHVNLVELLDGLPIEMHQPRNILDRHRAAQTADLRGEA